LPSNLIALCYLERVKARWGRLLGTTLAAIVFGWGCASTPKKGERAESTQPKSVWHLPKQQPDPIDKFNPIFWFGNIDDPVPPAKYRPDDPRRHSRWHRRNSLHNFTFYVIGIADKEFERVGRHPSEVFNPDEGWNWAVSKYRWWRLPFISYHKKGFKFYLGWRNHGNFGAKLNFNSPEPVKAKPLHAQNSTAAQASDQ
jgi:hypothetical protein